MVSGICGKCGRKGPVYRVKSDAESVLCRACFTLAHNIARRTAQPLNQSKPGWSKGMTWQELLDSRCSPAGGHG